jgi:hypothetical protein
MRPTFVLALVFICAFGVFAQTNKGGISGTVFDQTGAVIPGAAVTITNVGTNESIRLTSSEDGSFSAPVLDPVFYRITVEIGGFKRAVLERVKVDTATTAKVNVTLETGAPTVEVSVTALPPLINAESGALGQTITEQQIVAIPLNNRSVLDLALTAANVAGDAGTEDPDLASTIPTPGF